MPCDLIYSEPTPQTVKPLQINAERCKGDAAFHWSPEASPQLSNYAQNAGKQDMLLEQCSEFFGQGAQAIFPHLGNECKEHQTLAEEGQLSRSRCPQHPVHAPRLSRLAEQGEQRMGQHGQQAQRVSPVIACDDNLLESPSEARVLHVPESLLNGMITNDKCCCTRWSQPPLSWWRRPLRRRSYPGDQSILLRPGFHRRRRN